MANVVATLSRVGCIALGPSRLDVGSWWYVTDFGLGCLEYLRTSESGG